MAAATLHKHKTSNVDEAAVDLEEGLFCLHVEAAALLSPSFKQTARRGSLMRKPSGKAQALSECARRPAPAATLSRSLAACTGRARRVARAGSGRRAMRRALRPPPARPWQVRGAACAARGGRCAAACACKRSHAARSRQHRTPARMSVLLRKADVAGPKGVCCCAGKGPESPQAASEARFTAGCVRVRAWLTKAELRIEAAPRSCTLLRPACAVGGDRLPEAVPFDEILSASARQCTGCLPCCCPSRRARPGALWYRITRQHAVSAQAWSG